jgi:flagellar basal body rod protein FlgB
MTPTTAIILAGDTIDAAWQQQTGARTRAEVPVGDAPMYLHVVRALRQVDAIGDILLIGDAPAGEGYTTLPARDSLLENVRLGLERSPTDSVLFATVDLPFLTPESVRFFLSESLSSGAALTYAVVPADLCRERFPRHISLPPAAQPQSVMPVPQPTPMRTDGSTIDPEYELAQLAENELRYAMLVRIANGQIRTLQTAIREGRTQ